MKKQMEERLQALRHLKELIGAPVMGPVYPVWSGLPQHLQERMENANSDRTAAKWSRTVSRLPEWTTAVPVPDKRFISHARWVWGEYICGNEELFQVLLRHAVEYARTGRTRAIAVIGPPGIGKTAVGQVYARMLGLPYYFIYAPSAATGRGLAGDPGLYSGSACGCLADAILTTGTGNPVIHIDELEKVGRGHSNKADLREELLAALDGSAEHWTDNYLEFPIDISHIPFYITANDKSRLPEPLLDRVDVVEMKPLTYETVRSITKKFTIPRKIRSYGSEQRAVVFREDAADYMVDTMWRRGFTDNRDYEKMVERLISDAYIDYLEGDEQETIAITRETMEAKLPPPMRTEVQIGFR